MRRCALYVVLLAVVAACGSKAANHTGVDVSIEYDRGLDVNSLEFSGWFAGLPAFNGDERPDPQEDRELNPDGENLVILLNSSLAGETIFLRVDGVDLSGSLVGSVGTDFAVIADTIPSVSLRLGERRNCGDGIRHPDAEQCDDGNPFGGDGCTGECVLEEGWECGGEPSVCRFCGNDVCEVGEDVCSCDVDCDVAFPGDGECCAEGGETPCTSEDCRSGDPCMDDACCGGEIDTCGPDGDCADCDNGACETEKGEDVCSCPQDCNNADPPVLNNNACCLLAGEDPDDGDCCELDVIDGRCCFGETADTNPADCCGSSQCGDTACCPNESAQCDECCDDVCKDETCCGNENTANCPQDCCDSCKDNGCAPASCCADLCMVGAQCDLACPMLGCNCQFECEANSTCDVNCTVGNCTVLCGTGAVCNVTCGGGGGGPPGDGGISMDTGITLGGSCVCFGAGCNLSCAGSEGVCPPNGVSCGGFCPPPPPGSD